MLCSVLDANITTKMVRLGSRSADERISVYSLEAMEKVAGQSRLDRAFGRNFRALKEVEDEVKKLLNDFLKIPVDSQQIVTYLEVQYPEHYEHTTQPPPWIPTIKSVSSADGEWKRAGKKGKNDIFDDSMYSYWKNGRDLDFLEFGINDVASPNQVLSDNVPSANSFSALEVADEESDDDEEQIAEEDNLRDEPPPVQPVVHLSDFQNPDEFFVGFGYDGVPQVPYTDRTLDILLEYGEIWEMSRSEREKLHAYWIEQVRSNLHHNQLHQFERLRERHADTLQRFNEGKDEVSKPCASVIECRTNSVYSAGQTATSSECGYSRMYYYRWAPPKCAKMNEVTN